MNNLKCISCGNDLSIGPLLLSKSRKIGCDEKRYVHCIECGKTYTLNINKIKLEEIDYTEEGIEEDIVYSLNDVLRKLPKQDEETQKKCNGGCNSCNCNN